MARCAVEPARDLVVLHAVDHPPEVREPHRRAVAVGDDQRRKAGGVGELPVGLDRVGLVGAPQRAGRQVDVAVLRRPSRPRRCRCSAPASACGIELDRAPRTSASRTPAPAPRRRWSRCAGRGTSRRTRRAADSGSVVELSAQVQNRRRSTGSPSGSSAGGMSGGQLALRPGRSPPARPARRRRCRGSSANWRVIWVLPRPLVDVIESMPGDGRELLLQRRRHRGRHGLGARARQARA